MARTAGFIALGGPSVGNLVERHALRGPSLSDDVQAASLELPRTVLHIKGNMPGGGAGPLARHWRQADGEARLLSVPPTGRRHV